MSSGVRVVATAGMSPAVLTELGWWSARFGPQVEVIHVWTTGDCRSAVEAHLDNWWEALRCDVDGAKLPARDALEVCELAVPDVRDARDADVVAASIHDHVRQLTEADGPIIGWFAGGRKTMSSALQSAMTLYGRPGDELWHVLVHPKIEALPRAELTTFHWPTEDWARRVDEPVDQLVSVAKVPFAAVMRFLDAQLCRKAWSEVHALQREVERIGTALRAELEFPTTHRVRGRATLRFFDGCRCIHTIELDLAQARFYEGLVHTRGIPGGKPTEKEHKLASRLRKAFGVVQYSLASGFCVENVPGEGYRIPAHDRVTILRGRRPVSG